MTEGSGEVTVSRIIIMLVDRLGRADLLIVYVPSSFSFSLQLLSVFLFGLLFKGFPRKGFVANDGDSVIKYFAFWPLDGVDGL